MTYRETPLHFECEGSALLAVVVRPDRETRIGVIVVVGGPQYRVGSHRQFVVLSRALASAGIACLRFDYRGMGDSEGDVIPFDATAPDIDAAIAAFRRFMPELRELVLWGLCDGATASAFAASNEAINGLALFNPWVRDAQLQVHSTVRYYYIRQLTDRAFWMKLLTGRVRVLEAARTFVHHAMRLLRRPGVSDGDANLATRLGRALSGAGRPTLIGLSENDQTAAEFRLAARSGPLREALQRPSVECVDLAGADHTFSSNPWRETVASETIRWITKTFGARDAQAFAVERSATTR